MELGFVAWPDLLHFPPDAILGLAMTLSYSRKLVCCCLDPNYNLIKHLIAPASTLLFLVPSSLGQKKLFYCPFGISAALFTLTLHLHASQKFLNLCVAFSQVGYNLDFFFKLNYCIQKMEEYTEDEFSKPLYSRM